eukprot:2926254-Rhodomonas_salina.5
MGILLARCAISAPGMADWGLVARVECGRVTVGLLGQVFAGGLTAFVLATGLGYQWMRWKISGNTDLKPQHNSRQLAKLRQKVCGFSSPLPGTHCNHSLRTVAPEL